MTLQTRRGRASSAGMIVAVPTSESSRSLRPVRGVRPVRAALLAVLTVLALAGCAVEAPETSPTSPPATPTAAVATPDPTPTGPVTFEDASAAYEACLVTEGSSTEEIPVGENLDALAELGDASDDVLAEMGLEREFVLAHATCWPDFAAAIAAGATPTPVPTATESADPEQAAMMREAVACLNDRGWDFLEPGTETGELTMEPREDGFDWDDEGFLADQEECQRLAGMMG